MSSDQWIASTVHHLVYLHPSRRILRKETEYRQQPGPPDDTGHLSEVSDRHVGGSIPGGHAVLRGIHRHNDPPVTQRNDGVLS